MIRRFALVLLFISVAMLAAGGDIAMFENLGFSGDARVFLFGQYGIDAENGMPYAELYAVDVSSNSYVSGGALVTDGLLGTGDAAPLSLGQDGRGALFHLIGEAQELIERHNVDHLSNGRPIYILVDGEEPKERIAFRDFNTDTRYALVLHQEQRNADGSVEASFHIELTVTYEDDRSRTVTVGRPGYFRSDIAQYRITQVLLSPDEDSIVTVVEKQSADGSVRYMVETTRID
ncbi:MAG: DUF2259 domain-containing protein [Spirochaetales bacterium]|nr:DUF2259 domain-containing protein [Spirochaetales bacterium]